MESNRFNSIDEYIANCPEDVQQKLKDMRATIQAAAPKAGTPTVGRFRNTH